MTPADRGVADCRLVAGPTSGGDVAALIVTAADEDQLQAMAAAVVRSPRAAAWRRSSHNDTRIAGRVHADGVPSTGILSVIAAVAWAGGKRMVGAGDRRSPRAMLNAEAEPDYLFFGVLDGDRDAEFSAPWSRRWWAVPSFGGGDGRRGHRISLPRAMPHRLRHAAARCGTCRGPAAAVADASARLGSRRGRPHDPTGRP
jgi:hypothetical protein